MATFPPYVKFSWRDLKAKPQSVVERTQMDRGLAKQRRVAANPVVTVPLTLYFDTRDDSLAFEDWFYSAAGANGGTAWFDWSDPSTNPATVRSVRVVNGELGELAASQKTFAATSRTLTVEYLRSPA